VNNDESPVVEVKVCYVDREQLEVIILFVMVSKYPLYNQGLKLSINSCKGYLPNVEGSKDD
jgi:hypothetical protein